MSKRRKTHSNFKKTKKQMNKEDREGKEKAHVAKVSSRQGTRVASKAKKAEAIMVRTFY